MKLLQVLPPVRELVVTIDLKALAQRQTLLDVAETITQVTTADENEMVSQCGLGIQKMIKDAKEAGLQLRRPINSDADKLKACEDNFCNPLLAARLRLERLAAVYRVEQERKADLERRARAEDISRLQEQERMADEKARLASEAGDLAGALMADLVSAAASNATTVAISTPTPEATKTAGQSFQGRVLGWECIDPVALWNARPELCNPPTPKAGAIKSICSPEHPIPGLRLWWKSKVSFNSR